LTLSNILKEEEKHKLDIPKQEVLQDVHVWVAGDETGNGKIGLMFSEEDYYIEYFLWGKPITKTRLRFNIFILVIHQDWQVVSRQCKY
jgi:hypothetical protein